MTEVLGFRELPSIDERDPQVVTKAADLLLATTSLAIPAFGIDASSEQEGTHFDAHIRHQGIVNNAVRMLGNQIMADPNFIMCTRPTALAPSELHCDTSFYIEVDNTFQPLEELQILRLHTNGAEAVAQTTFSSEIPGLNFAIEEPKDYYDPTLALLEPPIYRHLQTHHSSVVFVTDASFGRVTVHDFRAVGESQLRTYYTSDLAVFHSFESVEAACYNGSNGRQLLEYPEPAV